MRLPSGCLTPLVMAGYRLGERNSELMVRTARAATSSARSSPRLWATEARPRCSAGTNPCGKTSLPIRCVHRSLRQHHWWEWQGSHLIPHLYCSNTRVNLSPSRTAKLMILRKPKNRVDKTTSLRTPTTGYSLPQKPGHVVHVDRWHRQTQFQERIGKLADVVDAGVGQVRID